MATSTWCIRSLNDSHHRIFQILNNGDLLISPRVWQQTVFPFKQYQCIASKGEVVEASDGIFVYLSADDTEQLEL